MGNAYEMTTLVNYLNELDDIEKKKAAITTKTVEEYLLNKKKLEVNVKLINTLLA